MVPGPRVCGTDVPDALSNPRERKSRGVVLDGTKDPRERSRYRRTVRKVLRRSGVGDCELVADGGRRADARVSAVLDVKEDGTMTQKEQKTYEHVSCTIEASDPEAIGVEHLLRDVKDATVSTLTTQVKEKARALRGLETRLKEIKKYMELVLNDQLPVNQEILGELQNAFNGLPNLNLESYVKAFAVETNDAQLVIYLGSLIRTVVALHDLINNKMEQKERERVSDMNDAEVANDAMKKKKGKDEESANNKENDKNESNKKDSSMKK